jgi:general secretion pathway protein J
MMQETSDRQAGFALVESIAVLALSGLVLLTLVIATDLISRNSAAAARSANTLETIATGFAAVRRDLAGARFIRIGANAEDPILFSGSPQAVAIAVADDGISTTEGEGLVLLEARYEEGRGVLMRSSARLMPGTRGFGGIKFANPVVVLSGPWKYKFSYYDQKAATEQWAEKWTAFSRMPSGIRLDVLNDSGQRVVSSLVVKMHINSGGCAEPAHVDCASEAPAEGGQDSNGNSTGDGGQDGQK